MKHSDYLKKLKQDSKYISTHNEYKSRFELGAAIVRARISKGWSQAELAKQAGTKQANISRIEDASANPTLKTIHKILSALDINIHFAPTSSKSITTYKTVHFHAASTGIPVPNWPTYQNKDISTSEGTM